MSDRTRELRQLTLTRIILFLREPEALFWVFLFPVVLALVLGIAFKNRGAEKVPVGHVAGALDEKWVKALEEADNLRSEVYEDAGTAEKKLRSGAIAAILDGSSSVTIRYDPTRPEGENARLRVNDAIQAAAGRVDIVSVATDPVSEHGSRYIDFLIPGLLGMNLMGTSIWGTGFGIVDMRQKKLLKRFIVTPMRRTNFLLAQMFSRFIFLALEVIVITLFGVLILGVPFRGSILLFAAICVLGALCFSGLGLLIAARPQTIEGVSGLMNFVMMPMWLLSGVFFSYENFPKFFHPIVRLLPLTALNDSLRALMLEGESLAGVAWALGVQAVWMVGCFVVALKVFRWR